MRSNILMLCALGMLGACVAQHPASTSVTSTSSSAVDAVQSGREQCSASCNDTYNSCMDSHAAQNGGVNGPSGMFGASADCRNDLKDCLPKCKAR